MGRIENYDNDSGISTFDRLFGTSYEGIVDGRPVYKTKNYLMGEIISKVTSEVASAGDRYSVMSYKFSGQSLYDLGDDESGVLDLETSISNSKFWKIVQGSPGKALYVNSIVVYQKKGSIEFDYTYTCNFSVYNHSVGINSEYTFLIDNTKSEDIYSHFAFPNIASYLEVGKPLMLRVLNNDVMTQGDGELGIWIEYKYLDFNLDFNG
jgi:hypothetical protein